jgi:uncharacterized protein involved in exopolysaccharide biosynthesis
MTSTAVSGSPLQPILRTFSRHRGKMALFFVVVFGGVVAFVVWGPRTYLSEAKLLVRLGRENVTLDPTVTLGQASVMAVPTSRENDINSVLEVVRSRALLERVVDALGPQTILDEEPLPADDARRPMQRYQAVRQLSRRLSADAVKKSNVISISFEGASPDLSQAVVAKVVDLFLDYHLHLSRTPKAPQFLAEQVGRLRAELARSEEALKRLKDRTGLVAPDAQRQQVVLRISKLEDDLLQTESALAGAEAEARLLRQEQAGLPRTQVLSQTKGFANQGADTMRGLWYALQLEELKKRTQFPAESPEMQQLRKQIAAAREILDREEQTREQVAVGPGRAYEETQVALLKQEPVLAGLKARAATLRAQLAREREGLKAFNRSQLDVARQQRVVDLQDGLYRKYTESVEQAQIDEALTQERITNISIVQPATYELKPIRPRVGTTLAVGLLFALLGSAGLALAAEYLKGTAAGAGGPAAPAGVAAPGGPGPADAVVTVAGPAEAACNGTG